MQLKRNPKLRLSPVQHFMDQIIRDVFPCSVIKTIRVLPVGFLLIRYSVLFTVESLSLLFLLVIYLDLYVLGDDALISKGYFMQTKYIMCLNPQMNLG